MSAAAFHLKFELFSQFCLDFDGLILIVDYRNGDEEAEEIFTEIRVIGSKCSRFSRVFQIVAFNLPIFLFFTFLCTVNYFYVALCFILESSSSFSRS